MNEIDKLNNPEPRKRCDLCLHGITSCVEQGKIFCLLKESYKNINDKCGAFILDPKKINEHYEPKGLKG